MASSLARSGARKASRPCTNWHATESARPMPRGDSSLNMLIVAAILALGVGYYVPQTFSAKPAVDNARPAVDGVRQKTATKSSWAASAAGRVEPIGGEIR